ncbi:MAG: biotin--[acetyl-CoA-carboxylase] ligase [Candidatus Fusobacterium pullicola]|uniref:biotin--[biotin carboxyl-carrier protein] ligase n=1 Tax=Candidatus Fusobacterium pullicola TaxID=2838601 RepID=A0A9E2NXI1_9FUSO|nr:biotin--[acetyl-CoA-carboxylase] ligase [Candidatus Fusobacterium pullicola]
MRVFRFDEIDSTNKFLKEQNNLQDYDCVIAKTQTAGVGRRGNVWVSNEGMAIFSFALKEAENISLEEYMRLPLIAGISVLSGLKKIEYLDYKFKWTNDIYLDDKKLCGILVEKTKDFFIIGIGININNSDFGYAQDRAISLKNKTGNFYRIEDIIFCIINEFKRYFSEEWSFVLKEINSYNYLKDKEIEIVKYGESLGVGVAKDIAEDGRLIVEIDGQEKLFNIGEIHIRK